MSESRAERAKKFAAMHAEARIQVGRSQDYMAAKLKVSTNTVKNWEKGVSSPDFFESLRWFEGLNMNPLPSYLAYISPYKTSNLKQDDTSKVKESFRALNNELPPATKQALIYMFTGEHGGSSTTVVQLLLAYLHLPLKTRIIPAMSIALRYDMEKEMNAILCENAILPNMEELNFALDRAYQASIQGERGYTVTNTIEDGADSEESVNQKIRFAAMHMEARMSVGISQEDMAMELGVTKNTIKNWEKGISMPSFFQSLEWFRVLNINPYPWYLPFVSLFGRQNQVSEGKEQSINRQFRALAEKLTVDEKRAVLFLFYGNHGSAPFAVVQLFLAYFHIPLKNRLISGVTIAHMYKLESGINNIVCKDTLLPDKELLESGIMKNREKVLQEAGFAVADKHPSSGEV